MIPVILSGGSGTRLWPLSRPMFPKQFLPLTSDNTMFQETLMRVKNVTDAQPLVIANNDHRFMAAENLREMDYNNATIVLEETGRNTAPAIAVASLLAIKDNPDAILMILPADHTIQNVDAFTKACKEANTLAQKGYLVTFGIKPDTPNTNYGYIEAGSKISNNSYGLSSFKEKPDSHTAEKYLADGNYLWNSGMFVFQATAYLNELRKFYPDIYKHASSALNNSKQDLDFIRLASDDFEQCESISIDYAVMEKTNAGAVVSLDASWCDVGSWDALWSVLPKDTDGNVTKGDVMISDSTNSYVYSEYKFVSVLGVSDLIIADTKDALLVAHKDKVTGVKKIVDELKKANRSEGQHHRTVYRPWGNFDLIGSGARDQVKRITVLPHQKLSLQMHNKRAEHWIVVKGVATVTKEDETIILNENESIYISAGTKHSLENNSETDLEIIEVQTGDYLAEDDIIRFEDLYGRA